MWEEPMKQEWKLRVIYKTNGVKSTFISYQPTLGMCFNVVKDILCDEILNIYITRIKKENKNENN
jgi:hypothetical protein